MPAPSASNDVPALTGAKGAVLALDHAYLRERALFDRYSGALPRPHASAVLGATAGEWIELDALLAHYHALDSLGMSSGEAFDMGHTIGTRLHGQVLRTLLRLLGKLGTTPWAALGQAPKLWSRSWRGGGVMVDREGERHALVRVVSSAMCRSPYYRAALTGAFCAGIQDLCRSPRSFVRAASDTSFAFDLKWL